MPAQRTAALADRYVLEAVVGRGGMADVYRARDLVLGRPVAVKVLREGATDQARFLSEARTLAGLSHPGLVALLDAGADDGQLWLVMELINGTTLAECCRGRALDPAYVATIGAQLAQALAYVHTLGIIHRDVKPGNVLLSDDGRVLLTDFGIAKLASDAADLTATGFTIGTAAYLAPEQIRRTDLGPATDVYSLGLVLLEALTGGRAYTGPPAEAAVARLKDPPAIPEYLPGKWQRLLRRMTALDPRDRPTMGRVAATLSALATAVRVNPTAALPVGQPSTEALSVLTASVEPAAERTDADGSVSSTSGIDPRRTRKRRQQVTAAVLLGVLVAVVVVVLLSMGGERAATPGTPPNLPPQIHEDLEGLHRAVNG